MLQGLKGLYLLHRAARNRKMAKLIRAEAAKHDPHRAEVQARLKLAKKLEAEADCFDHQAKGK